MFEQQRKLEEVKGKNPSLKTDAPQTPVKQTQPCIGNDKPESSAPVKEVAADEDQSKEMPSDNDRASSGRAMASETGAVGSSPHESWRMVFWKMVLIGDILDSDAN